MQIWSIANVVKSIHIKSAIGLKPGTHDVIDDDFGRGRLYSLSHLLIPRNLGALARDPHKRIDDKMYPTITDVTIDTSPGRRKL